MIPAASVHASTSFKRLNTVPMLQSAHPQTDGPIWGPHQQRPPTLHPRLQFCQARWPHHLIFPINQRTLVLRSTQLCLHVWKHPSGLPREMQTHAAKEPVSPAPPLAALAPYQFTVSAASFSAMKGRSALASHTTRQIQRRHWGIAEETPSLSLGGAGARRGQDPTPPGSAASHPQPGAGR